MLDELFWGFTVSDRTSRVDNKAWINVVEEYSQKALTVTTDKLAAMAGLASAISIPSGREYLSGVWKPNLIRELAWMADLSESPSGTHAYAAKPLPARIPNVPSWSWASMHQKLYFKPQCHRVKDPTNTPDDCENLVAIEAYNAQCIEVHGRLGKLRVKRINKRMSVSGKVVYHITPCTFEPIGATPEQRVFRSKQEVAIFDTLADVVGDGGTITCLRWIKWCDPGRNPIIYEKAGHHRKVTGAIVVTPVDLGTKTKIYRRTGWLEVVDDEFFRATR